MMTDVMSGSSTPVSRVGTQTCVERDPVHQVAFLRPAVIGERERLQMTKSVAREPVLHAGPDVAPGERRAQSCTPCPMANSATVAKASQASRPRSLRSAGQVGDPVRDGRERRARQHVIDDELERPRQKRLDGNARQHEASSPAMPRHSDRACPAMGKRARLMRRPGARAACACSAYSRAVAAAGGEQRRVRARSR